MLQYGRIDVKLMLTEHGLCECIICHYWCFIQVSVSFQPKACDGIHDLIQKAMSFNEIAILFIKENYYRIHFWHMSKNEDINISEMLI